MTDVTHTPQEELGIRTKSTPRSSSASATANSREDGDTQGHAKGGGSDPDYFQKLTKPALSRLKNAALDDHADDETRSTTTDTTEGSVAAQAGSAAPSLPRTPAESTEDEIERSAAVGGNDAEENEKSAADASPFWNQDYSSATMPGPPKINLAARTHPLAGGSAEHGGVPLCEDAQAELDDERADGTREPAYNEAVEFKPGEEDSYSSDEAGEEEGRTKRLLKRMKGGAKVISGRIRGDSERVKEGQDIMGPV
ncbi:hypothetical protein K438DRAFT_1749907 [Mycena galopus ATCC 62051]|nr:hypothetical protein K438DRAFT_1749907 [Mycena galopus ATCC 62051]